MLKLKNKHDNRELTVTVTNSERAHFVLLFHDAGDSPLSVFGFELDRASDWKIVEL